MPRNTRSGQGPLHACNHACMHVEGAEALVTDTVSFRREQQTDRYSADMSQGQLRRRMAQDRWLERSRQISAQLVAHHPCAMFLLCQATEATTVHAFRHDLSHRCKVPKTDTHQKPSTSCFRNRSSAIHREGDSTSADPTSPGYLTMWDVPFTSRYVKHRYCESVYCMHGCMCMCHANCGARHAWCRWGRSRGASSPCKAVILGALRHSGTTAIHGGSTGAIQPNFQGP